jgi:hypothetical protein
VRFDDDAMSEGLCSNERRMTCRMEICNFFGISSVFSRGVLWDLERAFQGGCDEGFLGLGVTSMIDGLSYRAFCVFFKLVNV